MHIKNDFPAYLLEYIPNILDQANVGLVLTDPSKADNPIVYANDFFYSMFGLTSDEVLGKNCRFLHKNDMQQSGLIELKNAIKNRQASSTTLRNYKKDGTLIYNSLTVTPIYSDTQELKFFLGIQKDITGIYYSLEQAKATESLAMLGYWELDLRSNSLFWSDEIYDLFEIDKNNFEATYEAFLNAIHPDDREMVNRAYQESLKNQKEYTIEHRLLMPSGEIKYVQERCKTYFDESAKPLRSIGTIQNITYTKNIELELQSTLSFFEGHKHAIDESGIVSKSNKHGIITYVNDNFCKISGYTKEEVIGKPHSIVRHPLTPSALFKDLWETIKAKKVWKKTIRNRDKFGKSYWVDTTILPILDQNDDIEEYIAIRHDVTQMIEQQNELNYIANNDILTGLGNRYKLLRDINESSLPALAILNIDNFSYINDLYGHEVGDNVIKEFAYKLTKSKISSACNLYHMQGDEFVILYQNIQKEKFMGYVKDMEEKLSQEKILLNDDYFVFNFSVGVSFEPKETILSTADMALRIAKNNNRGLIVYKEEISLNKEYENNIKWTKIIKEAVEEDKIIPLFQPIVNNTSKKWEKYEALVRIEDGDKLISPYFFLEISKKTRHYVTISKIMIQKTFDFFKDKDVEFSLNLTIEDILNSELKHFIFSLLQEYKIGKNVVFEIVESESIENFEAVIEFIHRVKQHGCKIAIDDFGTGYSNFLYLIKLKADYLKIDGSLIKDIHTNPSTELVVKNLVNFAQDLGMKTIAEFVENRDILEKVESLGIDYSQGYHFSEPKRITQIFKD